MRVNEKSALWQTEKVLTISQHKMLWLLRASAYALVGLQVFTTVMFLSGMAQIFGENLSIVKLVFLFIDIFDFNRAIAYRLVIGSAMGVWYIISLIILIKNLVVSLKSIKRLEPNFSVLFNELESLLERLCTVFTMVILFCITTNIFSENSFNWLLIAYLIIVCAVKIFTDTAITCVKTLKIDSTDIAVTAVKNALIYSLICVSVAVLNNATFKDLWDGVNVFVSLNLGSTPVDLLYNGYRLIILPIMHIGLTMLLLRCIHYQFSCNSVNIKKTNGFILKLIIFDLVLLILQLIFMGLIAGGTFSGKIFTAWFLTSKNSYLPVLLTLIAWWILRKYLPEKQLEF